MDYESLDDFFVSPDEGQPEFVVSFKLSNSTFLSCVQIQEDDDDLEEIYESHPMMLMIKYKRTDLLGHPLCRALVRYKWTTVIDTLRLTERTHSNNINILLQFGQFVFYFNVVYYCVFIGLFTAFMLYSTKPHDPLELSNMSNNPKYT